MTSMLKQIWYFFTKSRCGICGKYIINGEESSSPLFPKPEHHICQARRSGDYLGISELKERVERLERRIMEMEGDKNDN